MKHHAGAAITATLFLLALQSAHSGELCQSLKPNEICFKMLEMNGLDPEPERFLVQYPFAPNTAGAPNLLCAESVLNSEYRCQIKQCDAQPPKTHTHVIRFPKSPMYNNADSQSMRVTTEGCEIKSSSLENTGSTIDVVYRHKYMDSFRLASVAISRATAQVAPADKVLIQKVQHAVFTGQTASFDYAKDLVAATFTSNAIDANTFSSKLASNGGQFLQLAELALDTATQAGLTETGRNRYRQLAKQYQAYAYTNAAIMYTTINAIQMQQDWRDEIKKMVDDDKANSWTAANAYVESKTGVATTNVADGRLQNVQQALQHPTHLTLDKKELDNLNQAIKLF